MLRKNGLHLKALLDSNNQVPDDDRKSKRPRADKIFAKIRSPHITSIMSYGAALRSYTAGTLAARLATLPVAETITASLGTAAAGLAETVREALSTPPSGPHDAPWAETGALRDSIAYSVDDHTAVIGSNDPAAAPQEFGTATVPPRPFLAPAAAAQGEMIARRVGTAVAALFSDS